MTNKSDFGLIVYDVPATDMAVYQKIRRVLRGKAVRINMSAYVFRWDFREQLIKLQKSLPHVNIHIAKFSQEAEADIDQMVKSAWNIFVMQTTKTLIKYIENLQGDKFYRYTESKLEEAIALATIFALSEELKDFEVVIRNLTNAITKKQDLQTVEV